MQRIKQLRRARGWSQSRLAGLAAVDPATLNLMERGRSNPSLATLRKVAGALGVPVGELLEETAKVA